MYVKNLMNKIILIVFLTENFIGINMFVNNYIEGIPKSHICLSSKIPTFKCLNDEMIDIQNYINFVFNGTLVDSNQKYYPTENPKISIIISIYNGEAYLKTAILSIQNQDMKDIEIVIVDDHSKDNSIKLIKEIMLSEPRIVLYRNDENRGALYTKSRGVLSSKGKYVLLLDEDDLYIQREAFSTLYDEAERNNLDILKFKSISSEPKLKRIKHNRLNIDYPIIYQPNVSELMFSHNSKGEIEFTEGILTNCLIKKDILIKAINQIDDKYMKQNIYILDDNFIFYLLTKTANSYKFIDRFFYFIVSGWNKINKNTKFRDDEKKKSILLKRCTNLLNFIEFILNKTENTYYDKQIAFFSFNTWYLKDECKNFINTKEMAKNISKLYIDNEYIRKEDKRTLQDFFK